MSKPEKRNFSLKMNLACGSDDLRPIMQHIYFDNGFMIATDAYIIIKAAVGKFSQFDQSEINILNGKFIHRNTFKKIMSCRSVSITEAGIVDLATKDLYCFADPEVKFPNYEPIIPTTNAPIKRIGLTPKIAAKIFTILSNTDADSVKLEFTSEVSGIKIIGCGEYEGSLTCVLMPSKLHD